MRGADPASRSVLLLQVILAFACRYAHATQSFEQGLEAMLNQAHTSGRPLMLIVSAPWCGSCRKLSKALDTAPDMKSLKGKFLIAELDGSINPAAADALGAAAYPTTLFLGGDGAELGRVVGFNGSRPFARDALRMHAKWRGRADASPSGSKRGPKIITIPADHQPKRSKRRKRSNRPRRRSTKRRAGARSDVMVVQRRGP